MSVLSPWTNARGYSKNLKADINWLGRTAEENTVIKADRILCTEETMAVVRKKIVDTPEQEKNQFIEGVQVIQLGKQINKSKFSYKSTSGKESLRKLQSL